MTLTSIYQAIIPTSAHSVGLIVDPGAEVLLELASWVEVSLFFFFNVLFVSLLSNLFPVESLLLLLSPHSLEMQ
jgi:hypothetical protein